MKEIEKLDKRIDRLEDRLERTEIRLEQINLSEIIVKGREILDIYSRLHQYGVIDIFNVENDILNIKQRLNRIEYHPWEWLERDPRARQAFLTVLNKRIAEEVRQASLFTMYQEQPNIVVRIVRDVVKDYLKIWEINDQVALELVDNVIREKYFNEIIKNVLSVILSEQNINHMKDMIVNKDELINIKKYLEGEWENVE